MTTELVVLAPIVIVLLLLVVGLGRYAHGKQLVEQAAAAAARAASLTSTAAQANTQAQRAAAGSLADAGVSCTGMTTTVDTGSFRPGGVVTVTITCTADLTDIAISGLPGTATFTATGRARPGSSPSVRRSRSPAMTPPSAIPAARLGVAIRRRWMRLQDDRDRGSITAYLLIMTVALVLLAGLVLDGGAALTAHGTAADTAQQAARAGADALDDTSLRTTTPAGLATNPGAARAAAQAVLAASRRHRRRHRHRDHRHRHRPRHPAHRDPGHRRHHPGRRHRHRDRRPPARHHHRSALT